MRTEYLRSLPVLVAGLTLLIGAGCASLKGVPEKSVMQLLPAEQDAWNRPLRLTRSSGVQFNADFHPASNSLVYVSAGAGVAGGLTGAAGILLQHDPLGSIEPPDRLALSSARDRWPRLDPAGKRLVFVSTREDSAGDIWLLTFRRFIFGSGLRKLTDSSTADDQPCWHPDGRMIFYASSPSLNQPFSLWQLEPGGTPVRLTEEGQMPDCSPDGRYLVFVSTRGSGSPHLCLLRLADKATAVLTSGPELDLYPCWSSDGKHIFFSRIALDTNGDGRLDQRDSSAIFSIPFSEGVFAGKAPSPARQVTSFASSASFARPVRGGFLFTQLTGPSSTAVFALGDSGEMPTLHKLSQFLDFARRVEKQQPADVYHRLLAWQNVQWAARTASAGGEVESDLERPAEAAVAWLQAGRALLELGQLAAARRSFEALVADFPDAHRYVGLAKVELLALQRRTLAPGLGADQAAWQKHLTDAGKLEQQFRAYADEARKRGASEEATALQETSALALLEAGQARLARKEYAAALDAFSAVPAQYPAQAEACARAMLAAADVYRLLNQPETLRDTYLKLLRQYPALSPYAAIAAGKAVDTIVAPGAGFDDKLAGLRELVENYVDVPVLPALAQNYVGDLHYARKDYLRAVEEYERTIARFPTEASQVAAAYLAIGRIRTEQQDYEKAVAIFQRMEALFAKSGGWLYAEARRGYVSSLLLKAQRALDLDDVQLALGTYARLLDFDASLPAGHRGLVQCYARLGRVNEAILTYRARVESPSGARDPVAPYTLALAYSYYGPSDWVGNRSATRLRARIDLVALGLTDRAVALASDVPYYHQLRGFLLSRLALTTGQADYRGQALDAYLGALGLSRPEDDAANYANLLFNAGEGYVLAGQPETAYDYFKRADEAGFSFVSARGEAALTEISQSAMAAGDYAYAIRLLERALAIQQEAARKAPIPSRTASLAGLDQLSPFRRQPAAAALRRQAETLDRLALVYHLDADYAKAAERYRRCAEVVESLIAADPGASAAYRRNLLRTHRNLAVNLYLAVESGQLDQARLVECYGLLKEAAERLGSVGVVEWEEGKSPGLVTIDVDVALGRSASPARFDLAAEERLLYTYLARLNAIGGDYGEAVRWLRKKASLYPAPGKRPEQVGMLTEQSVVWSQIGAYELARDDAAAAADAYRVAVALANEAGSLEGEAESAVSYGRAVLAAYAGPEQAGRPGAPGKMLADAVATHLALLERIRRAGGAHSVSAEAALEANLSALLRVAPARAEVAR